MRRALKVKQLLLVSVISMVLSAATRADPIVFNLDGSNSGTPNSVVSFRGTLTNVGPPAVFLNGYNFSLTASGLTLDDRPFFSLPLSLAPNQTTGFVELFRITIGGSVSPGTFTGTFTILGGPTPNSFDNLAQQNFQISVVPSAIPEPTTLVLLSIGMGGVIAAVGRRNKIKEKSAPSRLIRPTLI
jgi:hypothetical protein